MKKKLFLISFFLALPICINAAETAYECGPVSSANASAAARLEIYSYCINNGSYFQAHLLLKDDGAKALVKSENSLVQQAQALTDLKALLDREWKLETQNVLSKALILRIGDGKILSSCGVGPEIEKLIPWAEKNVSRYGEDDNAKKNIEILKTAARDWKIVFGDVQTSTYTWKGYGSGLDITKEEWQKLTLLKRNAILNQLALEEKRVILKQIEQGKPENSPKFIKYFDEMKEELENARQAQKAMEKAQNSSVLTAKQKKEIQDAETYEEKVNLLNRYFDGSEAGRGADVLLGVNSKRATSANEAFDASGRKTMSTMLTSSLTQVLKDTDAGTQAIGSGLKVEVGFCDKGYSELREDGSIVIDQSVIEQYMRLKGYTADSVIKNKNQLEEIAVYVSPEIVYQSARRDQEKWAKKTYKPHTQEDEIDAKSREALFMTEKMKKDPSFAAVFTSLQDYSAYAAKHLGNASSYTQGRKMFSDSVRMSNPDLPTIRSASANTVNIINEEIKRISAMTAAQRMEERPDEGSLISYSEALSYTPDEIRTFIHEIQYEALLELRKALTSDDYAKYNLASIRKSRDSYNALMGQ